MEYIYSAMLLHSVGKDINEANVEGVLKAAGETPDKARIKALIAALDGVDIEEAMNTAVAMPAAGSAAPAAAPAAADDKPAEDKKDDKKDEEEKEVSQEEAASGLGALFG